MGVYSEMACEVVERLEPAAREHIEPRTFARVIQICADYAERRLGIKPDPLKLPNLPAMSFIEGRFLRLGDRVWRPDYRYTIVDGIVFETTGVQVIYESGQSELVFGGEYRRVAMSRREADEWNERRAGFDDTTLELLDQMYGN